MYEDGYRSPSRDGGSYRDRERRRRCSRSRSPYARRTDSQDGGNRRSRKDSPGPTRHLNYDDPVDEDAGHWTEPGRIHSQMYRQHSGMDMRTAGTAGTYANHDANSANAAWDHGDSPGVDGVHRADLHASVSDIRHAISGPWEETYRHRHVPARSDGAHYPDRDDRSSPRHPPGRHGPRLGHGDTHAVRPSDGYGPSVPDSRRHGHHPHGRHLDRRQLAASGRAVVLDGLPEDATERDILYGLDYVTKDRHFSSDKVRLARLRYDHNGHRTAFVEFHRRSDAEYFLDRYYPDISFPLEHSRGLDSEPITVGISSPRDRGEMDSSRDSRRDGEGWDCIKCGAINYPHRAVCFKCKAERPEDDYGGSGPFLTGETDECPQQTPSHYVVIRDLEGSVTEEVLAKGVMKLFIENQEPPKQTPTATNKLKSTAPTASTVGLGAKPGSLRRVFLMRDLKTNESWRYGFAEFATVEDAMAAVAKFRASPRFTIASKPVVVAFIHTGVFIPAFDDPAPENQNVSFTPIYNPSVRVKYWDERAYPSVRVISEDPLPGAPSPDRSGGPEDTGKSAARSSKKGKTTKEPAPVAKVAMMPQMQLWAKASAELHGLKPSTDAAAAVVAEPQDVELAGHGDSREADDAHLDGPVCPQPGDQYISYGDWEAMSCLACGWEAPTQEVIDDRGWPQTRGDLLIEHEGRAHHFFFRDEQAKEKASAALAALGREPRTIVRRTPRLKSERLPVYKSYADLDRLRCVLCKRVFKELRLVWLHEQQSELHKRMLADAANRKRATEELKTMGKRLRVLEPDAEFKSQWEELRRVRFLGRQYRDRALERRRAFGRFKQPGVSSVHPAGVGGGGGGQTIPEKRKEPAAETVGDRDNNKEPAAKKSKGAGMLAKMGWTAGAGLGAEGAGRTEAIATEVYAPGVGLGAEGGRLGDAAEEAARNTRGDFAAFVQKTKERARERFEKM